MTKDQGQMNDVREKIVAAARILTNILNDNDPSRRRRMKGEKR